jgi:cold-inducible RNA-binding protein
MGKKLYIGNLSYSVDSSELEKLFADRGKTVSAEIVVDRDTGRSKGFGFVEMSSDEEAAAAIAALNGAEHLGRPLTVTEAAPRSPKGAFQSKPLGILIEPGEATAEEIGALLAEVSKLYRMVGGSGITFTLRDVRSMSEALV